MHYAELAFMQRVPELAVLCEHADHVDVKTAIGDVDLRTFLANMWNYRPSWMIALFGVRAIFVRFLGLRQQRSPRKRLATPETIPMQKGERVGFFKVLIAREEEYWIGEVKDTHLNALLAVVVEKLPNEQQRRFHVITIVYYNNWAGPVYFNVIRPFHHLVVGSMALAGTQNREYPSR